MQVSSAKFSVGDKTGKIVSMLKSVTEKKGEVNPSILADALVLIGDFQTLRRGPISTLPSRAYSNNDLLEIALSIWGEKHFNDILAIIENVNEGLKELKDKSTCSNMSEVIDFFDKLHNKCFTERIY